MEHDQNMIVKSQAFLVINHQIDALIKDVRSNLQIAIVRMEDARSNSSIDTRVSYEEGGREDGSVEIGFAMHEAEKIAECLLDAVAANKQIDELQRLKLRLLNDYDFTHGHNEEQIKIFGQPNG